MEDVVIPKAGGRLHVLRVVSPSATPNGLSNHSMERGFSRQCFLLYDLTLPFTECNSYKWLISRYQPNAYPHQQALFWQTTGQKKALWPIRLLAEAARHLSRLSPASRKWRRTPHPSWGAQEKRGQRRPRSTTTRAMRSRVRTS
jgi:hypothetical protein